MIRDYAYESTGRGSVATRRSSRQRSGKWHIRRPDGSEVFVDKMCQDVGVDWEVFPPNLR